ncbi:hypothetical protein GVAV_002236 [Gurleya vavrai]
MFYRIALFRFLDTIKCAETITNFDNAYGYNITSMKGQDKFTFNDHQSPDIESLYKINAHYLRKTFNNLFLQEHQLKVKIDSKVISLSFSITNNRYDMDLQYFIDQFTKSSLELSKLKNFLNKTNYLNDENDYENCLFESLRQLKLFCENYEFSKKNLFFTESQFIAVNSILKILTKNKCDSPVFYVENIKIKQSKLKRFKIKLVRTIDLNNIKKIIKSNITFFEFYNAESKILKDKTANEAFNFLITSKNYDFFIKNNYNDFVKFFTTSFYMWKIYNKKELIFSYSIPFDFKLFHFETFFFENQDFLDKITLESFKENGLITKVNISVKNNQKINNDNLIMQILNNKRKNFLLKCQNITEYINCTNNKKKINTKELAQNVLLEKKSEKIEFDIAFIIKYQKSECYYEYLILTFFEFLKCEKERLDIQYEIQSLEYKMLIFKQTCHKNEFEKYTENIKFVINNHYEICNEKLSKIDKYLKFHHENLTKNLLDIITAKTLDLKLFEHFKYNLNCLSNLIIFRKKEILDNTKRNLFAKISANNRFNNFFVQLKYAYDEKETFLNRKKTFIDKNKLEQLCWNKYLSNMYDSLNDKQIDNCYIEKMLKSIFEKELQSEFFRTVYNKNIELLINKIQRLCSKKIKIEKVVNIKIDLVCNCFLE